MRTQLIVILAAVGGWQYYEQTNERNQVPLFTEQQETLDKSKLNFACDGRQYCSQMTSLEEAVFFINSCPNTKMDGDNDGSPCENDTRLR